MKRIFLTTTLYLCICATSWVFAAATCPPVNSKAITMKVVKGHKVYFAKLLGKPALKLQTDIHNHWPLIKFGTMMLTPQSPYFVNCSYDNGDFILKIQPHELYATHKKCTLIGAKAGDAQTTSVVIICRSNKAADCKLVCE